MSIFSASLFCGFFSPVVCDPSSYSYKISGMDIQNRHMRFLWKFLKYLIYYIQGYDCLSQYLARYLVLITWRIRHDDTIICIIIKVGGIDNSKFPLCYAIFLLHMIWCKYNTRIQLDLVLWKVSQEKKIQPYDYAIRCVYSYEYSWFDLECNQLRPVE